MHKDKSFKHIHSVLWPLVKRHDGKFKRELLGYYLKKVLKLAWWRFVFHLKKIKNFFF